MSNEKKSGVTGGLKLAGGNMTIGNPIGGGHGGSGSSLSAGASTILAASLEREAQRERERDNYTATVRSAFCGICFRFNLFNLLLIVFIFQA